jgi:hypothetical protein
MSLLRQGVCHVTRRAEIDASKQLERFRLSPRGVGSRVAMGTWVALDA